MKRAGPNTIIGEGGEIYRKLKYGKTLKQVAKYINERSKKLGVEAYVESWESSTDRHWKGSRLRWPGKGRNGSRIIVFKLGGSWINSGDIKLDHKNSDTYRRVDEVLQWLNAWEQGFEYTPFGKTTWTRHGLGTVGK